MKKLILLGSILGLMSVSAVADGALRGDAGEPEARKLAGGRAPNRVLANQFNAVNGGGPFGFAEDYMGHSAGYYARNSVTWGLLVVGGVGNVALGGDNGKMWAQSMLALNAGVNWLWSLVRGYQIKDCSWTTDTDQRFDDC